MEMDVSLHGAIVEQVRTKRPVFFRLGAAGR